MMNKMKHEKRGYGQQKDSHLFIYPPENRNARKMM